MPEMGNDIKGQMRSRQKCCSILSGYGNRPSDFDDLIHIIDPELRLVTPTDPEGKEDATASQEKAGEKYYQLTHDYLVHPLHDWLTRRRRRNEGMAGRSSCWRTVPPCGMHALRTANYRRS